MCMLLVDDESLIRMLMTESLREEGHDVAEAATGGQTIEIIRQSAHVFTAVVPDYHMPGDSNGYGVADAMRQAWPDKPVIIATGRPDSFQGEWRQRLGYRLLEKPHTADQLNTLVRTVIAQQRPGFHYIL